MKLLDRLSISYKVGLSFVAIAYLFLWVIQRHYDILEQSGQELLHWHQFAEQREVTALDLHRHFLQTRHAEKQFLIHPNDSTIQDVQQALQQTLAVMEQIRELPQVQQLLLTYQGHLLRVMDAWRRKGLSYNSGLQGHFREQIHHLEEDVQAIGESSRPAVELLLRIRRHEKDYLLRHEQRYIDMLLQTVAELKAEISTLKKLSRDSKSLQQALNHYTQAFLELVESDRQIDDWQQQMEQISDQITPLMDQYVQDGKNQSSQLSTNIDQQLRMQSAWSWFWILLALIIGSALVVLLIQRLNHDQKKLVEQEERMRAFMNAAVDGVVMINERGVIQSVNASMEQIFGYTQQEMVGHNVNMLMPSPYREEHDQYLRNHLETGHTKIVGNIREVTGKTKNDVLFPVELSVGKFIHNKTTFFTGILHDITERKRAKDALEEAYSALEQRVHERTRELHELNQQLLEQIQRQKEAESELRLAASVFANASEAILMTDSHGTIINVNDSYTTITGFSRDEAVGKNPRVAKSGRHSDSFYRDMWQAILNHGKWAGEIWDRRKNGEIYPKWLTINAVKNEHSQTSHYVGIFSDISAIKATEQKLEQLAYYDVLTGLPNRMLFRDRMEHEIAVAHRKNSKAALFFVDLDRFKQVNDTLGHAAGDQLLIEVGQRIGQCVRKSDTVARLGGDEFTVILTEVVRSSVVAHVAGNIIASLSEPVQLLGDQLAYIGASIGIALYPDDGHDFETLAKNADIAMYKAKENGRGNYQFFKEEMNLQSTRRLSLEHRLRKALERDELFLFYQPKADLPSGRISGMEALIRWRTTEGETISPGEFIPIAEESGLITAIGEWVVVTACTQAKQWYDQDRGDQAPFRMAINLSAAQFQKKGLRQFIETVLQQTGLPADFLEVEITESMMMGDVKQAIATMEDLCASGIHIAIDDFGTGYSSLGYLKRFPIHTLKVDQTFVRQLVTDSSDSAIVSAIISMAHRLNLEVVAEGVETKEQLDFLMKERCDKIQGYFLGRPLSAIDMEEQLLRKPSPLSDLI
ncbi:MAG: EAL domain-containing protein [Magnetococcales bacterium]|nr:EAL domain-containing protein [Magnetococcales bacterium]